MNSIQKSIIVAIACSIVLAGCASRPESISASYVSHEKFMKYTCSELNDLKDDAERDLKQYSAMQDNKANIDFATVFFILIPASQLSGDHEADVAKFKGMVEAIDTAQTIRGC